MFSYTSNPRRRRTVKEVPFAKKITTKAIAKEREYIAIMGYEKSLVFVSTLSWNIPIARVNQTCSTK